MLNTASEGELSNRIWADLHECFDTDDGSLPELSIVGLSESALEQCFRLLRLSSANRNEPYYFWDIETSSSRSIDSVASIARALRNGSAESFHFLAKSISIFGETLPDLGVFMSQSAVTLDYRMGEDWSPRRLIAFVRLVNLLQLYEPEAVIRLELSFQSFLNALEAIRRS